jgi:hypothetical protein
VRELDFLGAESTEMSKQTGILRKQFAFLLIQMKFISFLEAMNSTGWRKYLIPFHINYDTHKF